MVTYRIDESGYTGFDLLNDAQRFQSASAVAIENVDAARLIKEHFPNLKAAELKYRLLSRRPANHPRLLGLIRDLLSEYPCVTYVCDKRYLLALMFVDYAVEPFYQDLGGPDIYKDGANYGMASMLHVAGSTLLGRGAYDRMMASFQAAVRDKTPDALGKLVVAARETNWQSLDEVIGPIAVAFPGCIAAISNPGVSTDAALVVLQSLITRTEAMTDGAYKIEHDQSKNLSKYNQLIRNFIDHKASVEFRASEIASLKFPLKLSEVVQVDSIASPAVQVVDVLIGATIETAYKLTGLSDRGLDPEALLALYADGQFISMFPSIDFEGDKRFRRGSQTSEMID